MLRDKNLKRFSVLLFFSFFINPLLLYCINKLSISFGSLILENHSNAQRNNILHFKLQGRVERHKMIDRNKRKV